MKIDPKDKATEIGHGELKLKYNNRIVRVITYVNTDEDNNSLSAKVTQYLHTTDNKPLAISYAEVMEENEALNFWNEMLPLLKQNRNN